MEAQKGGKMGLRLHRREQESDNEWGLGLL